MYSLHVVYNAFEYISGILNAAMVARIERMFVRSTGREQSSNIDVPPWTVYNLRAIDPIFFSRCFLDSRDGTPWNGTRNELVRNAGPGGTGLDVMGRDTHAHVHAWTRVCRSAHRTRHKGGECARLVARPRNDSTFGSFKTRATCPRLSTR